MLTFKTGQRLLTIEDAVCAHIDLIEAREAERERRERQRLDAIKADCRTVIHSLMERVAATERVETVYQSWFVDLHDMREAVSHDLLYSARYHLRDGKIVSTLVSMTKAADRSTLLLWYSGVQREGKFKTFVAAATYALTGRHEESRGHASLV